jgi:hypothetical protein
VHCPLYDEFQYTSEDDGWTAWQRRMEHVEVSHHDKGQTLRSSRPDFHLFEHLWQKRLINNLELQELKAESHCLTRTASDFVNTNRWHGSNVMRSRHKFFSSSGVIDRPLAILGPTGPFRAEAPNKEVYRQVGRYRGSIDT